MPVFIQKKGVNCNKPAYILVIKLSPKKFLNKRSNVIKCQPSDKKFVLLHP